MLEQDFFVPSLASSLPRSRAAAGRSGHVAAPAATCGRGAPHPPSRVGGKRTNGVPPNGGAKGSADDVRGKGKCRSC